MSVNMDKSYSSAVQAAYASFPAEGERDYWAKFERASRRAAKVHQQAAEYSSKPGSDEERYA